MKEILVALAGNQNCGKTTLFNALTGSNQHVGNFPGVTVEKKEGKVRGHEEIRIVDLPGIYSLSPYTSEEIVTRDFILNEQPDVILIVPQGDEQAAQAYMNSVLEQSGWRDLEAVKNQRCWYLPKDLFHYKPNARWDEAYQYLIDLVETIPDENEG